MPSLNFPNHREIPDLDKLACQAEKLYSEHPDLCMFRCRQLLELLVQQYAKKGKVLLKNRDGLDANLQKLLQKNILNQKHHKILDQVRKLCNDACHYSPNCTNPLYWRNIALDVLRKISVQWAYFFNQLPPSNFVLPTNSTEQNNIDSLHVRLNVVEHVIEHERGQHERADILLQEIEREKLQWDRMSDEEHSFLELRLIGLRLALNNHKGIVTDKISSDKMEYFLEQDDARILSELSRYYNRFAVRYLNILDFDSTLEILDPWLEREEAQREYLPEDFHEIHIYQQSRGELLGTQGQALCMKGFCEQNTDLIHKGILCFQKAKSLFREEIDRHRQDSYLIHAYIDLLRLGEEITTSMRKEMDFFVTKNSTLNIRENHIGIYDLYLTIKIIHVLELDFSILSDVQYWLSKQDWTKMFFPMELILGHYLLIRGESAKNEKKYHEALYSVTYENNIRGFIAHLFYKEIHPNTNLSHIGQHFLDKIQNEHISAFFEKKQLDQTTVLPMYYY